MGNPPLLELYPGSVELWRDVMHRYVPARSFFDKQSQIRNWVAPEIPCEGGRNRVPAAQVESYAAPLYWVGSHAQVKFTGKYLRPVPVVRCRPRAPVFQLDCGELEHGLYVVRVIGAVETKNLLPFRRSLFVQMRVNDGVAGEISEYRLRIGYIDEFYSVAEIYFHAPERRVYRAELWVDEGSEVDLLVHNISLDDVLAGATRRAIKTNAAWPDRRERNLHPDFARRAKLTYTKEERYARDAAIWHAFPPLNCHPHYDDESGYRFSTKQGIQGKEAAAVEAEFGAWKMPAIFSAPFVYAGPDGVGTIFSDSLDDLGVLMRNDKLGLQYTVADWYRQKPLPAPYPFPDDGCGIVTFDPQQPGKGQLWCPIAAAVTQRYRDYFTAVIHGAKPNHPKYARDRAVALIRLAYEWPTMTNANCLLALVNNPPGSYDLRFRRRNNQSRLPWTHVHIQLAKAYDEMFESIQGNEDLAQSINRFIPWVKTSRDLIELLDVYLIQMQAKRLMRYHYCRDGHPELIVQPATILGDRSVTDPWMEWLFSRTWMYPLRPAGLQDYLISNHDRVGVSTIGSTSYGMGARALSAPALLEDYIRMGGNPRFDLRDARRYPKPVASTYFPLWERTAAIHWPRVGDVTGPDKSARLQAPDVVLGWRWTKDPAFAFILRHYGKREDFAEAEWREIEAAAATVKRAPWLDNRSCVLPNWAAFLEAGVEHDDFRFRRSVVLRCGQGVGHNHEDDFDLQIHAHGIPVTIDAGQRPGYSRPRDAERRMHNTVDVRGEGGPISGSGWIRALCDAEGARYLCAQAAQPGLYRRQVALLDVDAGRGAQPLNPAQTLTYAQELPRNVATPNSYVFDCFRVAGGNQHTYCFHGPVNDPAAVGGPQPRTNLAGVVRLGEATSDARAQTAAAYLEPFAQDRYFATAPAMLQVCFEVQKKRFVTPKIPAGTEQVYLGPAYDPQSPTKFLNVHLMNAEGALVMKGDLYCHQWEYHIPMFFVQRAAPAGGNLESVFMAIFEPYAGQPFIESVQKVVIPDNEGDVLQAAAVQVRTVNGHTDLCFADGRPERMRQFKMENAECKIAAEFAYYSADKDGVRQVMLTGGTRLEMPGISLRLVQRERRARVTKVDYLEKTLWIDQSWPEYDSRTTLPVAGPGGHYGRLIEIGTLPEDEAGYVTSYTASAIQPGPGGSVIRVIGGADLYRSRIRMVDEGAGVVHCSLPKPIPVGSFTRRLVASNEAMTKFWRAEMGERTQESYPIRLTGTPLAAADFAPENVLRLWEYGLGDTVRQVTFASVRRVALGEYEVSADADVEVTLGNRTWRFTAADLARNHGVVLVRLTR